MLVEEALAILLSDIGGLTALVDDRIYPTSFKQKKDTADSPAFPAVAYQLVERVFLGEPITPGAESQVARSTFRFMCVARGGGQRAFTTAKRVDEELRYGLHSYSGIISDDASPADTFEIQLISPPHDFEDWCDLNTDDYWSISHYDVFHAVPIQVFPTYEPAEDTMTIEQLTALLDANGMTALRKAEVTLTDAQIKALPTTPIQVVETPGAGHYVNVIDTQMLSRLTAPYTNIDVTDDAYLVLSDSIGVWSFSSYVPNNAGVNSLMSGLFSDDGALWKVPPPSASYDDLGHSGWGNSLYSTNIPYTFAENQPVMLVVENAGAGNFTGGHASNSLKITVLYSIEDV